MFDGIDDAGPSGTEGTAKEEYFGGLSSTTVEQLGLHRGDDPRYVQRDLGNYRNTIEFTATTVATTPLKRVVFATPKVYCNS